jgi:hypothetical protein
MPPPRLGKNGGVHVIERDRGGAAGQAGKDILGPGGREGGGLPEEDAQVFTPERGFRTGDMGHLDADGERLVIDLNTGAALLRLDGGTPAYHHAVSPDGFTLAVGNQRGEVELWDLRSGALTRTLQADGGPTMAVAFSPDGALLATAGFSERVMIWDTATGERLRAEAQHKGPALNLCFTPDGAALLSTGADGGVAVLPLTAHTRWAEAVADLGRGAILKAQALTRLGWWEPLHAALDAAVAAGGKDDPRARARAAWMLTKDDAAIEALNR